MSATQMPTKLQLRGPKAPPYDPRSDEHWQRFSQMLTILGFINCFASLLVIWLHWKLRLLTAGRVTLMGKLIFAMTVAQFVQDLTLAYKYPCNDKSKWTNDDLFWSSDAQAKFSPKRCTRSQWWLEEFSGLLVQSTCLQMSLIFYYTVTYQRSISQTLSKYFYHFNVAFVLYSLVVSSICAFATFDVKKAAYKVPPPPPNRPNSPSYYTPGYQGWLISETSRLGLACISLILCCASLWKFHDATTRDHERPTKNLVFRSLLNKIIWYPLLQAVTRVPCIYTIIFGSYNAIQLNGVAGADKLSLYYLYALLSPSGGILMMLVFLRNNAAAKQWCLESYRKCCSGLDHNDQSLLDAYAQGQDAANARRSSAAFADEEAGAQSSVYGRPSGAPTEKIQALLVQRCDDMDEGELTNILSSGAVASEEQWQSSVLRQDGRWMCRSSISRRIWLSLKSALSTKRAIVRRESSRAGGALELADRRASRSRSPSFTTGARRSISESPGTGRRLSLSSSSFPASESVSTLPPPPPPTPSPQLLERTARRPSSGRRASAPAGAYMLLHSSTFLVLLLSVVPTSALYNTTRSFCSSAAATASAEPAIFIIADMQPQTAVQERVAQHVRELAALFAPIKPVIVPPIFARKCNAQSHSLSQPHSPSSAAVNDKGHGSNLAHWSVWDNFARNSEACSLLVFEYDAFAASPMASADEGRNGCKLHDRHERLLSAALRLPPENDAPRRRTPAQASSRARP